MKLRLGLLATLDFLVLYYSKYGHGNSILIGARHAPARPFDFNAVFR
ncbi:MAG TPA: hypothetical protein VNY82_08750 [Steroidobacteraceae bacterium]|jgi:hypothetical protein|nr:hypothetical protein [Steroidobacteraceae bacterium]